MLYYLIILLIIWEVYWKYHALWLSANKSHRGWFLAVLIINSVGILPLYYLYTQDYFESE